MAEALIEGNPFIDILTELLTHRRLELGGQEVDAEVGRPDFVGFLDDQVAALVQSLRCPREGECHQQPEQGEERAFDRSQPGTIVLPVALPLTAPHPVTRFQHDEHAQEHQEADPGPIAELKDGTVHRR